MQTAQNQTDDTADTNGSPTNQNSTTSLENIGVYQHGIEMTFTGSYLDTLGYLKILQNLPWSFYWDDVLFDVDHYPKSTVIIRVHTLSLEEGWLGV